MKIHDEPKTRTPSRARATPVPNTLAHQAQLRSALHRAGVQPRLEIGAVNDPLEREADAAAERIMRMPELAASGAGGNLVQRSAAPTATPASPQLESSLNSLNSGGTSLDASTRAFFEPRFGQDFSRVRLHADTSAAEMAASLNAKAFTLGNDIAFGANQYSTHTPAGKNLLGHELAHVVQQGGRGGAVQAKWVQRESLMQLPSTVDKKLLRWDLYKDVHKTFDGTPEEKEELMENVKYLQKCLMIHGYLGYDIKNGFDGIYGNGTETALKNFRKDFALESSKIVTLEDWIALCNQTRLRDVEDLFRKEEDALKWLNIASPEQVGIVEAAYIVNQHIKAKDKNGKGTGAKYEYTLTGSLLAKKWSEILEKEYICCATYVSWVLRVAGHDVPLIHSSTALSGWCKSNGFELITDYEKLQAGDVVFMERDQKRKIGHTQIYAGKSENNDWWYNAGNMSSIKDGIYKNNKVKEKFIHAYRSPKMGGKLQCDTSASDLITHIRERTSKVSVPSKF